jgi:hypothetical protein
MENFILWSVSAESPHTLSFFATPANVPLIQDGTAAMLSEMLADLGLAGAAFTQWTVARFVTNYLMDSPPSDDWRDQWADTWEINVQLAAPIALVVEATTLIRTYARDASWRGDRTSHPARCVVIADFYSADTLGKALPILRQINRLQLDPALLDVLHARVPFVAKAVFARVQAAYRAHHTDAPPLAIRQRAGLPKQLLLDLGRFDEAFYAQGAVLAQAVADLVYELDGTTTWDETTHPNQYT